jgi:hypothetical protein
MNQIYQYEDQEAWTWEKMFGFENDGHKVLCGANGASGIMPSEEMKRWIPEP